MSEKMSKREIEDMVEAMNKKLEQQGQVFDDRLRSKRDYWQEVLDNWMEEK